MDVWITIGGKIKSNSNIKSKSNGQECLFHTFATGSAEVDDGGDDDGDDHESAQDVFIGGEPGFGLRGA